MISHLFIVSFLIFTGMFHTGFKNDQLRYSRVRTAYEHKEAYIDQLLEEQDLKKDNIHLYVRIFKEEGEVEVWVKKTEKMQFALLKTIPVCQSSGNLGPKRKQGDYQVPEGLYHIDRFNPFSNYYLSLGINYPNRSDQLLAEAENAGGDIFIHGNCVTIGCIPITDEYIEELYILAVEAKNNGQDQIQVHIFPFHLNDKNLDLAELSGKYANGTLVLWRQLKNAYVYFEKKQELPPFLIDDEGNYIFEKYKKREK